MPNNAQVERREGEGKVKVFFIRSFSFMKEKTPHEGKSVTNLRMIFPMQRICKKNLQMFEHLQTFSEKFPSNVCSSEMSHYLKEVIEGNDILTRKIVHDKKFGIQYCVWRLTLVAKKLYRHNYYCRNVLGYCKYAIISRCPFNSIPPFLIVDHHYLL